MKKYYKLLFKDRAQYSRYKWDVSGKWMQVKGELVECKNGFHVITFEQIPFWFECGFDLYEVEVDGKILNCDVKTVVEKVRIIRKIEKYNINLVLEVVNRAAKRAAKSAKSAEYAKYAAESAKYAEYAAKSAAKYAKYAAKSAAKYAEYAKYAAKSAEYAKYAAKYAEYAKYAAESERQNQVKDLRELLGI